MHNISLKMLAHKTNTVLFTRRWSFQVNAGDQGQGIALSPFFKYPGMIFILSRYNKQLTFAPHVRQVSEKAMKMVNAFNKTVPHARGQTYFLNVQNIYQRVDFTHLMEFSIIELIFTMCTIIKYKAMISH